MSKFITIIRPDFMQFCGDACKAAAFNHLLFRIAGKSKDQPKEEIQAGNILWYAKTEQITEEMSKAWGVCKVRKEVNALIKMGLIGRRVNPEWGADRTKHFSFGQEHCKVFQEFCEKHAICIVHIGLPPEVMHLIYSSNANDTSIKCICAIHQMELIEVSDANDTYIEAIPIDRPTIEDYKDDIKESTLDASASTHTQPINFEERKRKTDPQLQAISLSHSQVDIGNDDFNTDAHEREVIAAFLNADTVKVQAIPKGQADVSTPHSDLPRSDSVGHPGVRDEQHGERARETEAIEALGLEHSCGPDCPVCKQKPGAGGTHFSPADTPPSVSTGDATSVQAKSSNAGTLLPAPHSGLYSPGTLTSAGAEPVRTKRPRAKKPPVMPEPKPTITLTAQEQAFWDLWLAVWFNIDIPPKLTETAHEHVVKLAPHITSEPQLKSLIERAKQDLQERQGVTRRMVHLGNLVNSYPGWKQEQQQGKKKTSKNGLDLEQYGIQAMLRRQEAM